MQTFQERYVLLVDTSEMDSARSDVSETVVNEFVRRPGSGRRKMHTPWRSPWDASVCTVFASMPSSCSPLKNGGGGSGGAAADTAAAAPAGAECFSPCSVAHAPAEGAGGCGGAAANGSARRGKGKQELCGPCCHCGATSSPQWRKGPKGKPILCNACGIRFLRTRSLGKVTPKKRRSPVSAPAAAASIAAKRLKMADDTEDTEDGDEGRTSSGADDALEDAAPPEADTEEPTDELQDDMLTLHSSLQAAAAAVKLEAGGGAHGLPATGLPLLGGPSAPAAAARLRPAASGVAGLSLLGPSHEDEATGGAGAGAAAAFVASIKQSQQAMLAQRQQHVLAQQLQQLLAAQQQGQRAAAAAALAAQQQQQQQQQNAALLTPQLAMLAAVQPSVLQALGFGAGAPGISSGAAGLLPQLLKREGQGSAPSSPLVTPVPIAPPAAATPLSVAFDRAHSSNAGAADLAAAALQPGALDASLRMLLANMLPGGALAAAGAEDASGLVVQRSRSKGPVTSTRTG